MGGSWGLSIGVVADTRWISEVSSASKWSAVPESTLLDLVVDYGFDTCFYRGSGVPPRPQSYAVVWKRPTCPSIFLD